MPAALETFHSLSIHDLTRRSTGKGGVKMQKKSFNSRPHKEVDSSGFCTMRRQESNLSALGLEPICTRRDDRRPLK